MNQLQAMRDTVALAKDRGMEHVSMRTELSCTHLVEMLAAMESGVNPQDTERGFSDGKMGRWLGWAQAAVVAAGLATLEDFKEINKANMDGKPLPMQLRQRRADVEPVPDGFTADDFAAALSPLLSRNGATIRAELSNNFTVIIAALRRVASPPAAVSEAEVEAAARDVLAERERQKSVEGWTAEHDDEHCHGELAMAAACYSAPFAMKTMDVPHHYEATGSARYADDPSPMMRPAGGMVTVPELWPNWDGQSWKPGDRRRMLVKAGALLLAEIERLDRATLSSAGGKP